MCAHNFTPYGVKCLLECMTRATLLAQPDDIPEFLSTHVDEMRHHVRDDGSRDNKEVAFCYEEQWGEFKCADESPPPTFSVSSTYSESFLVSPSPERQVVIRQPSPNTDDEADDESPSFVGCQDSMDLTSEEKPPLPPPLSPPPGIEIRRTGGRGEICVGGLKASLPRMRARSFPFKERSDESLGSRLLIGRPTGYLYVTFSLLA
ncbi:hypothetical protein NQZ68_010274 [Dissostichus eleginoides]|nr:hypothetical protein NQZ68_010274 [Dissostichus eleginoides]